MPLVNANDCSRLRDSMKFITFTATTLLLLSTAMTAEAKSTRSFSGANPAEVEKNARNAGFTYPDGKMECSSRCTQRWGRD